MKHLKAISLLVIAALTLYACIEPFEFETEGFESALVVEAAITNEVKQHEVKLSRTFRFEEDGPALETGANVRVTTDFGIEFNFIETSEAGSYIATEAFGIQPQTEYKINIQTANGRKYASNFESTPQSSTIENVSAIRVTGDDGSPGVNILVDSFDPTGNSQYYRYTYDETYKIIPPYSRMDSLYSVNDEFPDCEVNFVGNPFATRGSVCYGTADSSDNIILTATADLNEDRVSQFSVRFIRKEDPIIAHRYSVLVNQFVVSIQTFEFYATLRDFSGTESLFSQTQPGFIEGNIFSEEDVDEKVIGIFNVATVSSKRLFFNYEDIFTEGGNRSYFYGCGAVAPPIIATFPQPSCPLPELLQEGHLIYGGPNENPGFDEGPYDMVQRRCGDCREFASEEIPDFWIE